MRGASKANDVIDGVEIPKKAKSNDFIEDELRKFLHDLTVNSEPLKYLPSEWWDAATGIILFDV
jgi:hypothetical protein